jgi:inner membrane protein
MLTNGGLGVAVFAPFSNHRYFFPWHPIQVSPIGIHHFFSEWGLRVLLSELLYVFIPGLVWIFLMSWIKRKNRNAG